MCIYIFFKIIIIYTKQIIIDGDGEFDPTKPKDQGAAGGATGGGDENPQEYKFSDVHVPSERRWEKEGAKPKKPYAYQKLIQRAGQKLQKPRPLRECLQDEL